MGAAAVTNLGESFRALVIDRDVAVVPVAPAESNGLLLLHVICVGLFRHGPSDVLRVYVCCVIAFSHWQTLCTPSVGR
jgi:hypothetical protein